MMDIVGQKQNGRIYQHTRLRVLTVFFLLCGCYGFAQSWLLKNYSDIGGLSGFHVTGITQDHAGRLWMTSGTSLACFNGNTWKTYGVNDGLPSVPLILLEVDAKGRIWVVSEAVKGKVHIFYFDPSKLVPGDRREWRRLESPPLDPNKPTRITSFLPTTQSGRSVPVLGTSNGGLFLFKGGKWERFGSENNFPNKINGLAVLGEHLYCATDNGLIVLDENGIMDTGLNEKLNLPTPEVLGICVQYKNKFEPTVSAQKNLAESWIWLYGNGWLGYFTRGGKEIVFYAVGVLFPNPDDIVRLLPDYYNGVYCAAYHSMYYFNYRTGRTMQLGVENGLANIGAHGMLIDFEKNLWFAGFRGITKISSRRFDNYQIPQGLLEDEVSAIMEYEPGKFLLGHNKGITFWENGRFRKKDFYENDGPMTRPGRVLDVCLDSKGNIWMACSLGGVAVVDKQKNIRWYTGSHGLPAASGCIFVDRFDKVWVGASQGLFRLENEKFVSVSVGSYGSPPIRKLFGKNGILTYMATHAGVYAFRNDKWKHYRVGGDVGRNENNAYSIYDAGNGKVLVGTAAGLYTLQPNGLEKFRANGFEIDQSVYFITAAPVPGVGSPPAVGPSAAEDGSSHTEYWFGTNNGLIQWTSPNGKAIHYAAGEGLLGRETNRAAGVFAGSGQFLVGTNKGLNVYNRQFDNLRSHIPAPKLRLLYMETEDKKVSLDAPINLSYKTHYLVFHFRGISFIDEKGIRFKHKLENYDKDWVKEHYPYGQTIRYGKLPPGKYIFRLKVRNSLGVWSEEVTSAAIYISKAFYKQWWFILILFLAALALISSVYHYYSTRRNAALLERLVAKRTEQLRSSEKRYRRLFEESKDMVFTTTGNGRFLDINPTGVALLGFGDREEAVRLDCFYDIFSVPSAREAFCKELKAKHYVKDFDLEVTRRNGERISVLITATVFSDSVKNAEYMPVRGIMRDVTETKRLQQQLTQSQKMEAIGTLAGGIAHDFNNILGVIIGYVEMALEDLEEDSLVGRNLRQVDIAANRAKELVRQILTFSRRGELEQKPITLAVIVNEALKLLRATLPATVIIRQDILAESEIVLADSTCIHQVVMNLCTNAAHAMRENGGTLYVRLDDIYLDGEKVKEYSDLAEGRYLELIVEDSGHGIHPAVVKRIFEPFFTTKNPGEGTGMGLAVIHGIVKGHGGDIVVKSEPGKGAAFHVLLPVVKEEKDATVDALCAYPFGSGERILLVDDEVPLVEMGRLMLESLGYTVTAKDNAREALDVFLAAPEDFDLLVTDRTMPLLTGIQLIREVRKQRPDIPVIFCTGSARPLAEEHARDAQIDRFLLKPINKSDLANAVREVLDLRVIAHGQRKADD
ncbi:MAG: response regulator [bacterium]|nr:response regulator [bacterium]